MSIALATKGVIAGVGGGGGDVIYEDRYIFAVDLGVSAQAIDVDVDTPPGITVDVETSAPIAIAITTEEPGITVDAGMNTISIHIDCTEV